jgi:hypothetical protein
MLVHGMFREMKARLRFWMTNPITLELSYDLSFATAKLTVNQTDFEGVQFYDSDYSDAGSLSEQAGEIHRLEF